MKHVVLLIPTHWSAVLGGAEYQAKILAEHLIASGRFKITLACRRFAADYRPAGYEIRQIAPHTGLRTRGFFLDYFRLNRLLEELAPDSIYQRVACGHTGIAAKYALRSGCNMIWHVSSDNDVTPVNHWGFRDNLVPFRRIEKAAVEYGIRHVPRIVVQTHHQSSLLKQHYQREATALVRNFHPLPHEVIDKSGVTTVLWIGNLKWVKNPQAFIALARALEELRDVRFSVVGDPFGEPASAREIEAHAKHLPRLCFLGKQSQEQVNELLSKSHLLVNTSHFEGFPNTFIQAWMRQVPVLSLNVDPDGLLAGEGIGFCAQGDEMALERSLRQLLSDRTRREQMGLRAQRYAGAQHSERNMLALIELLER